MARRERVSPPCVGLWTLTVCPGLARVRDEPARADETGVAPCAEKGPRRPGAHGAQESALRETFVHAMTGLGAEKAC